MDPEDRAWEVTLVGRPFTPHERDILGADNLAKFRYLAEKIVRMTDTQRADIHVFDELHMCPGSRKLPLNIETRDDRLMGFCPDCRTWTGVMMGALDEHGQIAVLVTAPR